MFWLQAIAPVILIIWLVRAWRGQTRAVPRAVLIAAAALIGWWGVTTITAVDTPTALYGMHGRWNGFINQALFVLLFLAAISSSPSRHETLIRLRIMVATLVPLA